MFDAGVQDALLFLVSFLSTKHDLSF